MLLFVAKNNSPITHIGEHKSVKTLSLNITHSCITLVQAKTVHTFTDTEITN